MGKLLSQCKGTSDPEVARAYGAYDALGKALELTDDEERE